jgi:hypothetical protein
MIVHAPVERLERRMVEAPAFAAEMHDGEHARGAERAAALELVERALLADRQVREREQTIGKAPLELVHGVVHLAAHGEVEPLEPVRDAEHRLLDAAAIEIGDETIDRRDLLVAPEEHARAAEDADSARLHLAHRLSGQNDLL